MGVQHQAVGVRRAAFRHGRITATLGWSYAWQRSGRNHLNGGNFCLVFAGSKVEVEDAIDDINAEFFDDRLIQPTCIRPNVVVSEEGLPFACNTEHASIGGIPIQFSKAQVNLVNAVGNRNRVREGGSIALNLKQRVINGASNRGGCSIGTTARKKLVGCP